jgi:hypothetical protein
MKDAARRVDRRDIVAAPRHATAAEAAVIREGVVDVEKVQPPLAQQI